VCLCIPLSLLGNGSVKVPLSLLGNGSVKNPPIVARQRLGRNVTAIKNTHATIEELLDASFSMWPVSYQGKYAISSSQNFLFNDTMSSSEFVAPNGVMNSELEAGQASSDMNYYPRILLEENREKRRRPQSGVIYLFGIEPETFLIRNRSGNHAIVKDKRTRDKCGLSLAQSFPASVGGGGGEPTVII
jgi:hypothetical protein